MACRFTALHYASSNGHTVTALALVHAGADVHCKDADGYGSRGFILGSVGFPTVSGRTVRPFGGGAAGVPALAVQVDGAALCVAEGPHGDGAGAGQGGRGRALQGQRRVRFSGLHRCVGWVITVRGGRSVHSGVELQECRFWLCRWTALHLASLNGHTETAMELVEAGADVHCTDNRGYGSSRLHPYVAGVPQCGADGPSTRMWSGRSACVWLCRCTALHLASHNGHTETAMALAKAGADVRCKSNDGYGSRSFILVSIVSLHCGADGPSTRRSGRSGCFGCAEARRCTLRRSTAARRRRWRWSRRARTCTARAATGTVPRGCIVGSVVLPQCGADGPSIRMWSGRSGCFGCAGERRCTRRRSKATRRRRWRWSRRARTCTARATKGTAARGESGLQALCATGK
jgi:hypothetical protein